jgi:hypothetical protein
MPHYSEKTGGLPHCQMLVPNLLVRHPADQQVNKEVSRSIPTATPRINQHSPLNRLTSHPQKKKKMNNKQGTEKEHTAEGVGYCKHTREEWRSKMLIST